MKVVILAGGFGTRISEESHLRPKPMIEIGDKPILWHIMKHYSYYGFNDFIICAGYKQHIIKEWFFNYYLHTSDITFDLSHNNQMTINNSVAEPWKVSVIDTGLNTMTGGRVKRIADYIDDDTFFLTYGDGVSDVDLNALLKTHKSSNNIVTLTAYNIAQDKGVLEVDDDDQIVAFREKEDMDGTLINVGFMACDKKLFDYLENDETVLEKEPLKSLAKEGKLGAYLHDGFWQCMDTQRDKQKLEKMWLDKDCPWRIW